MTVAHKNLTGVDLHEPKGVATANSGEVYVADGAGSGNWTSQSNSFGTALLHIQDKNAAGTTGALYTSGTWNSRVLNTVITNEISGASLATSFITLPAGTYFIQARACIYATTVTVAHQLQLYNNTNLAAVITGGAYSLTTGDVHDANLWGRFTLSGTKQLYLRHYVSAACLSGGPLNQTNEIFADVLIWEV